MLRLSHQRGQVLLIVTVLFTAAASAIGLGILSPTIRQTQVSTQFQLSKQSYYAADGASEDAYYRVRNGISFSSPTILALNNATATVTLTAVSNSEQELRSEGNASDLIRVVYKNLTVTDGFSFNFGMQSGLGGIQLNNNAAVNGNVYSTGSIVSTNSNPNSYNVVKGTVISAGPNGFVNQIHATSSVYSHTIKNSTIDGDAYYQSFDGATSSVTITGASHPNSADQPTTTMPISDSLISSWESTAASGGTVTCSGGTYTISSSVTIGPKKIPCDLTISGNGTVVTLTGTVWVTGNISITGSGGSGVQIRVSDSVGDKSVAIIADNLSTRTTGGIVTINGNSNFYGSTGHAGSYVMIISMNTSAEIGGSTIAIDVINGAAGNLLIYAPHGQIKLENNVNLREVTAYQLTLINNTVVNYAIGLAQTLFTSGPGGTWKIKHWTESI